MATIGKVKRLCTREKKSVREIVRLTSLQRNTVRKWLKTPVLEAPRYRRSGAAGKLTPFVETIKQSMKFDAHGSRHERRTASALRALRAQIKAEGYAANVNATLGLLSLSLAKAQAIVAADDEVLKGQHEADLAHERQRSARQSCL